MGKIGKNFYLRGSQPVKVDENGRVRIPEKFREIIESQYGKELFITSIDGKNILVYPLKVWEKIEAKVTKLSFFHPSITKFKERTSYFGNIITIDSKGRILVPPLLREKAQINGEVIVLGSINHLVIWNKEIFEKKLELEPITMEDLKTLSEFGI
ncbi:division/cell wall cluster transcriptional repressor MraZ [Candidatus Aminicenantes bacterium AC-708-M15]|jgi:MraZ protein|nr:division/cell wall cluster transcriptional repressor MraZ [SCandidatus Aminicenantes bacterium Aminicenantia_JdfR_composite]MCP2604043.1 division/cell wall cluster transcriptional repressor MraZ [Candidatus Aminicenantes bacterium AC-708-M15]MCP2618326.1 division/cell wall cluster transcriptional repressor MraZ [Candidatus Aminicenantes bacterium AC-335-A11]